MQEPGRAWTLYLCRIPVGASYRSTSGSRGRGSGREIPYIVSPTFNCPTLSITAMPVPSGDQCPSVIAHGVSENFWRHFPLFKSQRATQASYPPLRARSGFHGWPSMTQHSVLCPLSIILELQAREKPVGCLINTSTKTSKHKRIFLTSLTV